MSAEIASTTRAGLRHFRVDPAEGASTIGPWSVALISSTIIGAFILLGAGNLDLGPIEARLGLAAGEALGPLGRNLGSWEPSLWPLRVFVGQLWVLLGGDGTSAVRWPEAIAAGLAGLVLARRLGAALGGRAGLLACLCLCGSIACMDRSSGVGVEWVAGLLTLAALDRILGVGSDRVAGLYAALAFLAGGWPPLAIIGLPIVVIGRPGRSLSAGLVVPPLLAVAGWSAWALAAAPAVAWGAAMASPVMSGPAWSLPLRVALLGLPFGPLSLLCLSRKVRESLPTAARSLVMGWLQVAAVASLAGMVVPGLAGASILPSLAGLAVAAAAGLDAAIGRRVDGSTDRGLMAVAVVVSTLWAALAIAGGFYLAAAVSYYRPIAIGLALAGFATATTAIAAAATGRTWLAGVALLMVALGLRLTHWGVYTPEVNYRFSQGPWGRAIGHRVEPGGTVYAVHPWPADLCLAIGRPVRVLRHPRLLTFEDSSRPAYVLLAPSELVNWPVDAPRLSVVRSLQDERGQTRVLARAVPASPVEEGLGPAVGQGPPDPLARAEAEASQPDRADPELKRPD